MSIFSQFGTYIYELFASFTPNAPTNTPEPIISESNELQYRLDNDSSATFTLPDGRKLGYAIYGTSEGPTIFYLHGLPGSRLEGALYERRCLELGARLIAVERPNIGLSSPHPQATLLSEAKDIEYLSQHLEINQYGVMVCVTCSKIYSLLLTCVGSFRRWTPCACLCSGVAC
jgi:hypothetical protein